MSDALNEKALRRRSYFQQPDEPTPPRVLVLLTALVFSLNIIAVVMTLTYDAEHPAPSSTGPVYDTSWLHATVDGVPCTIAPGPAGVTHVYIETNPNHYRVPGMRPDHSYTQCDQLIPGGNGAYYQ